MIVPETPAQLIGEFLPNFVGRLLSAQPPPAAGQSPRGSGTAARRVPAAVGVGLRVVGAGEWTLRIVGERLLVEPQIQPDVALQVSLAERDFGPLVVTPLRRALAQRSGEISAAPALPVSLWARLGRWDEETVDLLRRQTASVLLRVQDGELKRCVALTPSIHPYSLEVAECTIDCALADLEQLQAKKGNPLDLFYAGQIRISGDAQVALAMAGLFL